MESNWFKIWNFNKITASYDPANRIQYTNTVTLEGNNAQANLTLQDEVTLHNVTTGETQTGGTYTLNAGQSFYLTAPNKNISDYQSNNVAGAGCERFTVLAIKDGASGTQTEGSGKSTLIVDNYIIQLTG